MAKSVQSQIEEYKQSIKAGRERADKVKADAIAAGVWKTGPSASNASDNYNPTTVTDPVTRVQREKEDNSGVFSEKKSTPSQSEIRADAAKKNLER